MSAPLIYGITAAGTVVSRSTALDYRYGVVRDGKLVSCHFDSQGAINKSVVGDQIVGLTRAPLHEGDRHYTANSTTHIFSFPLCYACANPGLGRAVRWVNGNPTGKAKKVFVPACIIRHAIKEAS